MTVSHSVLPLQTILQTKGYAITALDGIFGPETQAAMRVYETAHKLTISDQPTRELCDSLGIDLGPDFPYQPIATKGNPMSGILGSIFSGLLGNLFNWQLVQGYIRSGLLGLGGVLVSNGWISGSQENDAVGALLVIIGIAWSALSNNRKVQALDVVKAVDASPNVTLIKAQDTALGKPVVMAAK